MPTIQLPSVPNVQAAPYQGAPPADQTAKYRGTIQLAQGVQQAGNVMEEFALRSAEAKNAADLVRGRLAMDTAAKEFQTSLENNQDTRTWLKGFQDKAAQTQAAIFTNDLAPETRRQLEREFSAWSQNNTVTVQNQAVRKQNADSKLALDDAIDAAVDNGDAEAAHNYATMQGELGLRAPEDVNALQRHITQRVDVVNAQNDILEDPVAAEEKLNAKTPTGRDKYYADIPDNRRRALLVEARRESAVLRAQTVQGFQDQINKGIYVPPDVMQREVDKKHMTSTEMHYLNRQQTSGGADEELYVRAAQATRAADTYDPSQDPTTEKYWSIMRQTAGMPAYMRSIIEDRLRRSSRPETNAARETTAYIDRLYSANMLGDVRKQPSKLPNGEANPQEDEPMDKEAFLAANEKVVRLKSQLDQFLAANPKATPEEQTAFINSVISGDRTKQGATPLLNGISGRKQP